MNQQGLLWNVYYVATIVVRKQIKFSFVGEQSQISIRSYSQWHFESRPGNHATYDVYKYSPKAVKTLMYLKFYEYSTLYFIAFSRSSRTHPNLVSQASQAREIEIFCGLQIGRPSRFLQGLWASFSSPSVTSCLLSFVVSFVGFRLFGVFFEANWFLTLITFDKKTMQSQRSLE